MGSKRGKGGGRDREITSLLLTTSFLPNRKWTGEKETTGSRVGIAVGKFRTPSTTSTAARKRRRLTLVRKTTTTNLITVSAPRSIYRPPPQEVRKGLLFLLPPPQGGGGGLNRNTILDNGSARLYTKDVGGRKRGGERPFFLSPLHLCNHASPLMLLLP